MKLLILGNHTCGNRGDSAILRGLLDAINTLKPETEVDVMSRYPVSSSWLLNRPVMGDPLYSQMKQHNNAAGVMGRVKKVLRRRYQHQVLLSRVTDTGKLRNIAIALGNAPTTPAVLVALHSRRDHPSPIVREHVAWALAQHSAQNPTPQAAAP